MAKSTGTTAADRVKAQMNGTADAETTQNNSVIAGLARKPTPPKPRTRKAAPGEILPAKPTNGAKAPANGKTNGTKPKAPVAANAPEVVNGNGNAPAEPKPAKRNEKQELARVVIEAIAGLDLTDAQKVTASQWVHHLPTGHENGEGSPRWWAKGLPRPVRSDWK
jgi:hypothetical protein